MENDLPASMRVKTRFKDRQAQKMEQENRKGKETSWLMSNICIPADEYLIIFHI